MRRLITLALGAALSAAVACDDAAGLAPLPPEGSGRLELEPAASLDFGTMPADAWAGASIALSNSGDGPLTVREVILTGGDPATWRLPPADTWPARLEPGDTLAVAVEHRPCPALLEPGADRCSCRGGVRSGLIRVDTDTTPVPLTLALFATSTAPGPRISVSPPARLDVVEGRTATVSVVNTGCGTLKLQAANLTGPGGGGAYGGGRDLSIEGCSDWPCALDREVCRADAPGCAPTRLAVRYSNRDLVTEELAELRLGSDDPTAPERVLLLRAREGRTCRPPQANLRASAVEPCVAAPVTVTAEIQPAGGTLSWRWLFTPGAPPELVSDGARVTFTPSAAGPHILAVTAGDPTGCGLESESILTVPVRRTCR